MATKWQNLPIEITLVESPDIGIIGVGEGSTPSLKRFLKHYIFQNKHGCQNAMLFTSLASPLPIGAHNRVSMPMRIHLQVR
ncbi:MAG: hypothetical protein ACJAVV_001593 [Alphaproteobacteria bacterium]